MTPNTDMPPYARSRGAHQCSVHNASAMHRHETAQLLHAMRLDSGHRHNTMPEKNNQPPQTQVRRAGNLGVLYAKRNPTLVKTAAA